MSPTVFSTIMSLLCVSGLGAQQKTIDTQKSTMIIHVGKTRTSQHWVTSTKYAPQFTAAQLAAPRSPRLGSTSRRAY
jgi:hypothetical protein